MPRRRAGDMRLPGGTQGKAGASADAASGYSDEMKRGALVARAVNAATAASRSRRPCRRRRSGAAPTSMGRWRAASSMQRTLDRCQSALDGDADTFIVYLKLAK